MKLSIRRGEIADARECGTICYEAFSAISEKHAFPRDFPSADIPIGLVSMLLSRPDIYSAVAELDGKVVGSNFLWETADIFGVGPITVDPKAQDGSIGRKLMEDVIERARKRTAVGVRLVQAGYHNRSLALYTKLGFDVREPLSCIGGGPLGGKIPGLTVRAVTAVDVAPCNSLSRRIHGFTRETDLRDAIGQGMAMVAESQGKIIGYATSIGFFGHAVAETNDGLKALIAAAPAFSGPGFLLPNRNAELFRWCLHQGLKVVQPMTLMAMGEYQEPQGAFLPSILY